MPESCKGCKFFRAWEHNRYRPEDNGTGHCVRYPPQMGSRTMAHPSSSHPDNPRGETRYSSESTQSNPTMHEDNWCGEFVAAPPAEEVPSA